MILHLYCFVVFYLPFVDLNTYYNTRETLFIFKVVNMVRLIEVSHWGNIAVEETFHVKHTGAELKVTAGCCPH